MNDYRSKRDDSDYDIILYITIDISNFRFYFYEIKIKWDLINGLSNLKNRILPLQQKYGYVKFCFYYLHIIDIKIIPPNASRIPWQITHISLKRGFYAPLLILSNTAKENIPPNGTVNISIHHTDGAYSTINTEAMNNAIAVSAYSNVKLIRGLSFCVWIQLGFALLTEKSKSSRDRTALAIISLPALWGLNLHFVGLEPIRFCFIRVSWSPIMYLRRQGS